VYYYTNRENDQTDDEAHKNKTPPILAIVSDSFWFFSTGQRGVYEKATSWNETLARHFPAVFQRLVAVAQSG
jgi:hypothetical protein